jgi:biopolymer transport protein ExbB
MVRRTAFGLLFLGLIACAQAHAQQVKDAAPPDAPVADPTPAPASGGVSRKSVLSVFRPDNPMLWPLALCSVVTVGFTLERLTALRRSRVVPKDFVTRFTERLSSGKLDRDRATELCKANDSPIARVFGHIVRYWGQPATAIRQALESDAGAEILELKRNCRALNGTATLAPLLGLLGTVVGMIEAFDSLSSRAAGTGKSEALAHGISLALVTTALGLAIAIVSVSAYYVLLHKVDILSKEMDDAAGPVIDLVAGEAGRSSTDRRGVSGPSDGARHSRSDVL